MVSKNQIKFVKSLQQKKYRIAHQLFVVEGAKVIREFLQSSFQLHSLYSTDEGLFTDVNIMINHITAKDLERMSAFKTPNKALAVFEMPASKTLSFDGLVVALDEVRDPGNLGTIIRLCDWFGVQHLICSKHTVDVFNAKVVQSTMGSLARVNVVYEDLELILSNQKAPVFTAIMNGENVHKTKLPTKGVLVMGNESHGVSKAIQDMADRGLTIPKFGLEQTESLNVATATAILLNEFKRNA